MASSISAPYEAQFGIDGKSEMFAHTLEEMIGHIATVIRNNDKRFRGYVRVTNHVRSLVFVEVNVLGKLL